ncbi:MAG: dehydrogenase E1 component subunit alpha/beta [Candidatus Humimicrobiia bacterium]
MDESDLYIDNLKTYLRQMLEIRFFEQKVFELLSGDIIKGASHLYAGQEAVAVGAISAIKEDDYITSTHRGHGHCHAHGDMFLKTKEEKQNHLNKMMAELCGKVTGYCKGRGGSMHIANVEKGNLGATGIVGSNIPVATGAGLSIRLRKTDQVVLCFFGDGASNTGAFYESLNMASTWNLPVIYICENNLYGMSVPFSKASKVKNVADKAKAFDMESDIIDGMDVVSVREAIKKAVEKARRGGGPTLIECKTYRYYGHSRGDPRIYRTKEEEELWKQKDPIIKLKTKLLNEEIFNKEEIEDIERNALKSIEISTKFALESPFPRVNDLYKDVYIPVKVTKREIEEETKLRELIKKDKNIRQIYYVDALNEAIYEEMERDNRVFVLGEDVGVYGGAYQVTKGLIQKFGEERIRDTAISEAAIAGAAIGAAMTGLKPIAEIMYIDFSTIAMDQIVNIGAKNRYMFGGKSKIPIVIRTQGGTGRCIAAHHSQSLEALWLHFPGIYVVMPSTPYDAKGLLKTCIRDENPIMFIEHKELYGTKGPVPNFKYTIPLGVADIKKEGQDITIISYSRMVLRCLEASEELLDQGINVEVIDLRTLKPLDIDLIINSVKKTGRVIVVSEGYKTCGFTSELIALINEIAFDYLDAPIVRLAAADVPVPMSEILEKNSIPTKDEIINEAIRIIS